MLSLYSTLLENTIDYRPLTVTPEILLSDVLVLMSQIRGSCTLPIASDSLFDFCSLGNSPASCALVVEDRRLVGMFTEQDVVRLTATGSSLKGVTIADVMTQQPVSLTQNGTQDVLAALALFRQHQIRHLPVLGAEGLLIGLITPEGICQFLQPANLLKLRSIGEVMELEVLQAPLSASVLGLAQLMTKHASNYVVITEAMGTSVDPAVCRPVGILTERDIVQFQALELNLVEVQAETVMSTPLFCLQPTGSLWTAHQEMQRRNIRHLVIAGQQGELLGVITQLNMLRALDPVELFSVVNVLQQTVNRLEEENVFLLQTRNSELEQQVQERTVQLQQQTVQLQTLYQQAQAEIIERQQVEIERTQLLVREQAARAEAQNANRIKDEFLAVLSHELRSPLSPILGWVKMLQTHKLDEAKKAQALQVIERNARLQSQLIEDLLDVSRILQGKLSLDVAPVDLSATIQSAIETVRLAAEVKAIQICTLIDPGVGKVLGDSNRLQQIVWNLLSNAVKFTGSNGQIKICLAQIESQAQITVSDTGVGIHADFLPCVFDYFRQADSAKTRTFGGLGLGLAIVRQMVELHGGTVRADSAGEGQGATFTVRLPLIPLQQDTSQDFTAPPPLDLQGIRVLIVDDDTDTRDFVAFLLEQHGAVVTAVDSAAAVLKVLPQIKPDVLLSDIGMPDTDGYTLLREIRALESAHGGQTPSIALTAYAGSINRRQALEAGFQHHIAKPVEPAELIQVIVRVTEKARALK